MYITRPNPKPTRNSDVELREQMHGKIYDVTNMYVTLSVNQRPNASSNSNPNPKPGP